MIPLRRFLHATSSIYDRKWNVSPWGLLSWGLQQLGLVNGASADERLRVAQYVIVHNVEVCHDKGIAGHGNDD